MSDSAVVTFLFTDLVGSTEMLDRLGDDVAEQVRRTHFRLVARRGDRRRRRGGQESRRRADGRVRERVGGGALRDRRCNRRSPGTTPANATRSSTCGSGCTSASRSATKTITSDRRSWSRNGCAIAPTAARSSRRISLRGLVGTRGGFEFVPLGPLELKGLSEPVPSFEVTWQAPARTEQTARPLPPGLDQPTLARYVGRTAERDELMKAWKVAVAGGDEVGDGRGRARRR